MCTQQPPLQSCCCETAVSGMWRKQFPDSVKEAISGMPMTGSGSLDSVMKRADDVYFSTRNKLTATASVASVEVAAFRGRGRGNTRGRGNRGFRGAPANNTRGAAHNVTSTNTTVNPQRPKWGQKHPDNPPEGVCKQHYQHDKSAHFCRRVQDCPWKDFISPPPTN